MSDRYIAEYLILIVGIDAILLGLVFLGWVVATQPQRDYEALMRLKHEGHSSLEPESER